MGKRNRLREARRRRDESIVSAVLKKHSEVCAPARAAVQFEEFKPAYRDKVAALRGHALRAPEDWRCRIKSRAEDKRFLDLVRFCFARYRVAAHLERAWIDRVADDFADRNTPVDPSAPPGRNAPDLRRWYLIAAQGGSLHKAAAHKYLSKQECHHFLTAPDEVASIEQAFWYAIARAQTDRRENALRVSRTKILGYSVASCWWKEVARFFARNPGSIQEMNDLCDYLHVAKQEDDRLTLKGRTLATLRQRMEAWHRALRRSQAIGGGAWAGSPLPDADYEIGSERKKAIWRFRQIKTGNALFREGERMHHCVASYKFACMQGRVSIWSVTSEFPLGRINRGVTLEVTSDGRIVQCRGFANRLPYGNEVITVRRWANEHRLTWAAIER